MSACILCKEMPCCPEHCCNWDDCGCGDCDACVIKPQVQPLQSKPLIQEPVKIILLGNNALKAQLKEDQKLESVIEEKKSEPIKNIEEEDMSFSSAIEESKDELIDKSSPRAAGNGIFGIRYLRKKK